MVTEAENHAGSTADIRQPSAPDRSGSEKASDKDEAVAPSNQATCESQSETERMSQELAETKDRLLRTIAEMDNMRKRLDREKADFIKFSSENILRDMIPVLDSFEKACPPDSPSDIPELKAFREGVSMVQRQFLTALGKHGLEQVDAIGKIFDPNFHQAIQRIEDSVATSEVVANEFMKGYTLHGRLVRPSMVSVKVPAAGN